MSAQRFAIVKVGYQTFLLSPTKAQALVSALHGAVEVEWDYADGVERYVAKKEPDVEMRVLPSSFRIVKGKERTAKPAPTPAPVPAPMTPKPAAPKPSAPNNEDPDEEALCICTHKKWRHRISDGACSAHEGKCGCLNFVRDAAAPSPRAPAVRPASPVPPPIVEEAQFLHLRESILQSSPPEVLPPERQPAQLNGTRKALPPQRTFLLE